MTKADQDKVAYRLASHPGEIISCDVLDLRNLPGMNEERYVSVIIDHFTGYTSTKSLCRKQAIDVLKHIQEFVSFIEQQSERNVKIVRSDNGLEYNNEESSAYFKERGIFREMTAPYNPAGNGMVERRNRTLVEGVRKLLLKELEVFFLVYFKI